MNLSDFKWKSYNLHKTFLVDYGSKWDIGKTTDDNPEYAFVSRTSNNNGIVKYVDKINALEPYQAGLLTLALGGSIGSCFLQNEKFYTSQNVAVIGFKYDVPYEAKIFLTKIINFECVTRYQAFGRELNSHIKTDLSIKLPEGVNGEPDWELMKNYIISITKHAKNRLNKIITNTRGDKKIIKIFSEKVNSELFDKWAGNNNNKQQHSLKKDNWRTFKINELFKTFTGGDLIISEAKEGLIPVVTHKATNNSIGLFTCEITGRKLFDHTNTISVADRGTFFATIQNEDFYIGTRVKALEAKFACNQYILSFIVTVINNESFRFSYGRNCTGGLDDLVISLPASLNNVLKLKRGYSPDFDYMEKFIKSLPYTNNI